MKYYRYEYDGGWRSALARGTLPYPHSRVFVEALEAQNMDKARHALGDLNASLQVKAYWFGYLAALLRNN